MLIVPLVIQYLGIVSVKQFIRQMCHYDSEVKKSVLTADEENPDQSKKKTQDTSISITLSSRTRVTGEFCCVIMQEKDLPILPMTARASYGETSLPEGFTLDFSLKGGHHIAFHVKRWKRHWISQPNSWTPHWIRG